MMRQQIKYRIYLIQCSIILVLLLGSDNFIFSQSLCDTITESINSAPIDSEHSPKPTLNKKELEKIVNAKLGAENYPSHFSQKFKVIFYVDCKGNDFNYKMYAYKNGVLTPDTTSDFQNALIRCLNENVKWSPGKSNLSDNGLVQWRDADYQLVYNFKIKRNKIKIINKF